MDRKTIFILAGAVLVLLVLSPVVDHFFPPQPVPADQLAAATNAAAGLTNPPVNQTNFPPGSADHSGTIANLPAPGAAAAGGPAEASAPEKTLTVTNADLVFVFTSRGGGLKSIGLPAFPAVVSRSNRGADGSNYATLNTDEAAPILDILGDSAQGGEDFVLTQSNTTVRADRMQANGLRVTKTFDVGDNGTNYVFVARVHFQNTTKAALLLPNRQVVVGTAAPIGPLDDPTTLGVIWYNGTKSSDIRSTWFANRTLGCIPGTPRTLYDDGASNVVWAATHSQYFALAAVPSEPAPSIDVRQISLPIPDTNGLVAPSAKFLTNGLEAGFGYPAIVLAPGQTLDQSFTFYAGPKEYNHLAKIGQAMGNNLDLIMGFTGFLGFGFFSRLLLLSMNGIHATHLPYGLCIIAITVIVKMIFWPLTAASTRSQKRLQALQPQLKAIADKYKDDALKKHEKTTEFMKENKVNPMGSCLPMLIQIPVFYGFYSMIRNAIELRGVPFLWAHDLSLPDTVYIIPSLGFPINPLPLIMGVTQLWQAQLTPPQPGMDPGQQKLMRFMPLMFIAFFYRMSAGLTIYWTVSNLLTIAQTKLTKMGAAPVAARSQAPARKK